MTSSVIHLMDVYNWKDDAVHRYQQFNGYHLFDKGHHHDVKNTQSLCQLYLRESQMYQADFPNGDSVFGLGSSRSYLGIANAQGKFEMIFTFHHVWEEEVGAVVGVSAVIYIYIYI